MIADTKETGADSRLLGLPYPARSVLRRWRGMIGMVLGVGLALGISMTMLGVSQASVELFTGDYTRSQADLYVVTQGGKLISMLAGETPGTIEHSRNVLAQIRALPGVNTAIGVLSWTLERDVEGPTRRGREEPAELYAVLGIDGDPTVIPGAVVMSEGRWVRRTDELVVGGKLSRERRLGPGSRVRLAGREFRVVGVGRMRGVGYTSDSFAYLDIRALRQRADVGDVVNFIVVDTEQPDVGRERIPGFDSLAVFGVDDLVRQAREANETAIVMRWIMVGLTLAIAGLFVGNMLGGSVAARRQEFATLRALGIARRTILAVVAGEAVLINVLAGIVGVLVSLGFGALINGYLAPAYGFESLYAADARLFLTALGLAVGLGLLSGLAPARRATRVDPVEVLREA